MDIVGYGTKGTLPDSGLSADLRNNRGMHTLGNVAGATGFQSRCCCGRAAWKIESKSQQGEGSFGGFISFSNCPKMMEAPNMRGTNGTMGFVGPKDEHSRYNQDKP